MKSLTTSLWRDYQSCHYIVAEVEFRCSKIEDILQQQILKCFSSSLWQIRKLKFSCGVFFSWRIPNFTTNFPNSFLCPMFSFWSRNQKPPLFLMLLTTNFLRKKNDRGDGNPPDPPGLSALKMKSLEVPKGPKREVIQRHAAMQRLPLTFLPKVARSRPGAANCVHIMICYGAENRWKSQVVLLMMAESWRSPVEVGSLSQHLHRVIYPSWCRIPSINSMIEMKPMWTLIEAWFRLKIDKWIMN